MPKSPYGPRLMAHCALHRRLPRQPPQDSGAARRWSCSSSRQAGRFACRDAV